MSKYGKIFPISFGFGWGIVSGVGWMLLCWSAARWGFGVAIVNLMSSVYRHLAPTFIGGLWGFFWGFLNMFIVGIFLALIYNCSCKCFCPAGSCGTCE